MSISNKAKQAVLRLEKELDIEWTPEQEKAAKTVIELAMSDAIDETHKSSSHAIKECCNADMDLAHKINQEIKLARNALLANLNSLR